MKNNKVNDKDGIAMYYKEHVEPLLCKLAKVDGDASVSSSYDDDASYGSTKHCEVIGRATSNDAHLRKDSVLPLDVTYTAKIYPQNSKDGSHFIMREIPRRAVEFFDKGYTSDMFLEDVFRHEITLPDYMVPETWRDLDKKKGYYDEL